MSVDPLAEKYAQLSSYNYADNSPVTDLDIDGLQTTRSANSEGSKNPEPVAPNDNEKSELWSSIRIHLAKAAFYYSMGSEKKGNENMQNALIAYSRLTINNIDKLTESSKQEIFKKSSAQTQAIPLYEFASGTGPQHRDFNESHAIVKEFKATTSLPRNEVRNKVFFNYLTKGILTYSEGYQFSSSNKISELFYLHISIPKHIDAIGKLMQNPDSPELFLGGMSVNAKLDSKSGVLNYQFKDTKGLNSLLLHIPKDVSRPSPLGRTTQSYTFNDTIPRFFLVR